MTIKKIQKISTSARVRSRNYCFTDFNMTDFDTIYDDYKDVIRYMCWGKETCPNTKKIHLQGWIQMINAKDFNVVRKLLGGKVHLERMCGSEYQNDKYCKKDNDFVCKGRFKAQGFRSDMEEIKKTLDGGGTMLEIATSHFGDYIRYHGGLTKYAELILEETTKAWRKIEVIIHYGETGSGKTRTAVDDSPDHYMIRGDDLQWFDGYKGQKTLIIDEYSNQVVITKLLSLLDGYQLRLPIKGGFTYANWNKVYITTNLDYLHINAKEEHRDALSRRVTEIINFVTKC